MLGVLRNAWADARNFGVAGAAHRLVYLTLNRLVDYRVLKGVKVTRPDPAFLSGPEAYRYGFLDAETLRRFAVDSQYDLGQEFLNEALPKGDECFGILDGDTLASYGWYSRRPTNISEDLAIHFSPEFVYMYKGYTHPKYRGQRLHAIGMTKALQAYLERGHKGLISYVEANNYSSLKSCYRMGYEDVGEVYVARLFHRYRTWHTRGCRDHGWHVQQTPAARPEGAEHGLIA
jgi:hypothetical protein